MAPYSHWYVENLFLNIICAEKNIIFAEKNIIFAEKNVICAENNKIYTDTKIQYIVGPISRIPTQTRRTAYVTSKKKVTN